MSFTDQDNHVLLKSVLLPTVKQTVLIITKKMNPTSVFEMEFSAAQLLDVV